MIDRSPCGESGARCGPVLASREKLDSNTEPIASAPTASVAGAAGLRGSRWMGAVALRQRGSFGRVAAAAPRIPLMSPAAAATRLANKGHPDVIFWLWVTTEDALQDQALSPPTTPTSRRAPLACQHANEARRSRRSAGLPVAQPPAEEGASAPGAGRRAPSAPPAWRQSAVMRLRAASPIACSRPPAFILGAPATYWVTV